MESDSEQRRFRLGQDEKVAEGVRRIARGRLDKAGMRLHQAEDGTRARAIHGVRKDLKKARAVLRLVRSEIGEKVYNEENRRYRDLGRQLSASRDADVKLKALRSLELHAGGAFAPGPSLNWAEALEADRKRISQPKDFAGSRVGAELAEAALRIDGWQIGKHSWGSILPGLLLSYHSGRQELGRLHVDGSDDRVHEFRKRVKDLWYQLRLLRDAWPALLGETVDQLDELGEMLGEHHHLSVLAEDLKTRAGVVAKRKALRRSIRSRQDELLVEVLELGGRIYAEKPKALERRIHDYWTLWRGPS